MSAQAVARSVIDLGARATVLDAIDRVRASATSDELVLAVAAGAPVLKSPVFLEVLRRAAGTRRVALVTPDARARSLAASVHVPAFASVAALERHELDATEPLGPARRAAIASVAPRAISRVPGIVVAVALVTALAVLFAVVAPTATVVVAPVSQPLGPLEYDLRAGPNNADINGLTLGPANITAKITGTATGSRTEDTKAKGTERFTNQTTGDVRIGKGTIVKTSDNILFVTLEDRVLPKSAIVIFPPSVTFGTIDIPIEAVEPGTRGNVDAKKINQSPSPSQYSVENPQPLTGGDSKKFAVIQQSDYDAAAARADVELRKPADAQVETWKKQADKEHTVYGVVVTHASITPASDVVGKDATSGSSFDITVTGAAMGYSVANTEPRKTAVDRLAATSDSGYDIDKEGAVVDIVGAPTVDVSGVHWRVRARASQFQHVDEAAIRAALAGRALGTKEDVAEIARLVDGRGLRLVQVSTWPGWWPRLPVLDSRIQITSEAPAAASP
jgi:Baseplate J-like protein